MDDTQVLGRIEELVAEEHRLMRKEEDGTADARDHARMSELQVALDRAWDLLRQRRGMRDRGEDPDDATERSTNVVERYQQ
jgi:Protein of unknown function (DUF2630)